jgi:hypothetical protein
MTGRSFAAAVEKDARVEPGHDDKKISSLPDLIGQSFLVLKEKDARVECLARA